MACRLVGAKPLSEPMPIVNWALMNKLQWNFSQNSNIFIQENAFESVVCEMAAILSRPQCVKVLPHRILPQIDIDPSTKWLTMKTSSHESFFCVTGPLCGEFNNHRHPLYRSITGCDNSSKLFNPPLSWTKLTLTDDIFKCIFIDGFFFFVNSNYFT